MLPRLYSESYVYNLIDHISPQGDITNGLGFFTEVVKCEVTEALNKEYTLSMEILLSDRLAKEDMALKCILAKANPHDDPQFFRVSKVNFKTGSNTLEITANHLKNEFLNYTSIVENVPVGGDSSSLITVTGTPEDIMTYIFNNLFDDNKFVFSSNNINTYTFTFESKEQTIGDLYNNKDGLFDLFGGDLKFDNFEVKHKTHRGSRKAVATVNYGTNLSSYKQELSIENRYTHVLPWADVPVNTDYNGEISAVRLYGTVNGGAIPIDPNVTALFTRVLPIDFTYKFSRKKGYINPNPGPGGISHYAENQARLVTLGQRYVNNHPELISPKFSINVDVESALQNLQDIELGDEIRVVYKPLGYEANHRVTSVVYDSINERYKKITIGERQYNLYDFIKRRLR